MHAPTPAAHVRIVPLAADQISVGTFSQADALVEAAAWLRLNRIEFPVPSRPTYRPRRAHGPRFTGPVCVVRRQGQPIRSFLAHQPGDGRPAVVDH